MPTGGVLPSSRFSHYGTSRSIIRQKHALLASRGGGSSSGDSYKQRWGLPSSSSSKSENSFSSSSRDAPSDYIPTTTNNNNNNNKYNPVFSLAALPSTTGKFIKAALLLYGASELLSFLGFFNDDGYNNNNNKKLKQFLSQHTPRDLNKSLENFKRKATQYVDNAHDRAQQWLEETGIRDRDFNIQSTWSSLSDKSRFGIGALFGYTLVGKVTNLITTPFQIGKFLLFSYLTAEVLHATGITGQGPRLDDYVDKNAVREFAKETDLVNEMEDVMNYVDEKIIQRVDDTLQDFKLSNRRRRGKKRRLNVVKWADHKIEDWRRFVRGVLGQPQQLVDYVVDVAVEERHLGMGLIVGSFMGSIL